jgi:hypothetical protein
MTASEIKPQFDAAVATARLALEEFRKEPLITAKRGGPRLSPWWRVYVEASQVAARWCHCAAAQLVWVHHSTSATSKPSSPGTTSPASPISANTRAT